MPSASETSVPGQKFQSSQAVHGCDDIITGNFWSQVKCASLRFKVLSKVPNLIVLAFHGQLLHHWCLAVARNYLHCVISELFTTRKLPIRKKTLQSKTYLIRPLNSPLSLMRDNPGWGASLKNILTPFLR